MPKSFSAPSQSRMVEESVPVAVFNAILVGKFALMSPETIFILGLCVARIKCMPGALPSCAKFMMLSLNAFDACIIRSAYSSMTATMYGMSCVYGAGTFSICPRFNFCLKSLMFLHLHFSRITLRFSISFSSHFNAIVASSTFLMTCPEMRLCIFS